MVPSLPSLLLVLLVAVAPPIARAAAAPQQVAFDASTPLADRADIAARMLHGLQHERLLAHAAASGRPLKGQALDPRAERWQLFVPDSCRDAPCGLLVWVSPWDQAVPPRDWLASLESARVAYVAAERGGNDQDVLDRRVPLALLGLAGVRARLSIDPQRVFIGGFSGGGRVASRIAAGYPDVFHGGILVATSDGIGTSDAPVPPLARLAALRTGRWWFAVGDEDPENAAITHDAFKHWQRLCALGATLTRVTGWGHRTLDGRRLRDALRFLDASSATDAKDQADCERNLAAEAAAALAEVRRLRDAGERSTARAALLDAHRQYGGLIAEEFATLWAQATAEGWTAR